MSNEPLNLGEQKELGGALREAKDQGGVSDLNRRPRHLHLLRQSKVAHEERLTSNGDAKSKLEEKQNVSAIKEET